MLYRVVNSLVFLIRTVLRNFIFARNSYLCLRNIVGVNAIRLTVSRFCSQFINMAVMFMPIKIFILIAHSEGNSVVALLGIQMDRNIYIMFLFFITAFLYLINMAIGIYNGRGGNKEKRKIVTKTYFYQGGGFDRYYLRKTFSNVIGVSSDMLMIMVSVVVLSFFSYIYSMAFLAFSFVQILIYEYILHVNNRYSFIERLDVDSSSFVTIVNNIFYLFFFFILVYIYMSNDLDVYLVILSLLVSRLANRSVKSLTLNISKIKNEIAKNE